MARKRKVEVQDDGTPVEIDAGDDAADMAAAVSEVFAEPPAHGVVGPLAVIWTARGESDGVYSEHGQHKAGDEVLTRHSATLIAFGYAEKK